MRLPHSVVIMGVAGCGKSSLGDALAQRTGWPMIEGDDFHSEENRARMRAGAALTDADREGWLQTLASELRSHTQGAVLTCSALKRAYRDTLRTASPQLRFVFLEITREEALRRIQARSGHFFPAQLLDSQFATLEVPHDERDVLALHAELPRAKLLDRTMEWLTKSS